MSQLDLTRMPSGQLGWSKFVDDVRAFDDSAERYFLELKSDVDLGSNAGRMKVVKFVLGALNRDPVKAEKRFGGHALMVLGVGGGQALGIAGFEAKDLAEAVRKYVGAEADRLWDFERVDVGDRDQSVIVVQVVPPTGAVWTSLRDGIGLRDGGIYVRGDGETREAKGDEVRELLRRGASAPVVEPPSQQLLARARAFSSAVVDANAYPTVAGASPSEAGLEQTRNMVSEISPLLATCIKLGADGSGRDADVAAQVVLGLGRGGFEPLSGHEVLIRLRKLPGLLSMLAGALGAVSTRNGEMFTAFVSRPQADPTRLGHLVPFASVVSPWDPFGPDWHQAQLVADSLEGRWVGGDDFAAYDTGRVERRRRSAASDIVRHVLRPVAAHLVMSEVDYKDMFDRVEVLVGAIVQDWVLHQAHMAWGAENWVSDHIAGVRYGAGPVPERILVECVEAGGDWWPLRGGAFGGDGGRARSALRGFADMTEEARRRRY